MKNSQKVKNLFFRGALIEKLFVVGSDGIDSISTLKRFDRLAIIFWLLGPFILLSERTLSDIWLSSLALMFLGRAIVLRDWNFLKAFWVKAGLVFWLWCIISGLLSEMPVYSSSEALVWGRFPIFAMAVCFWLGKDKRILHLMLLSTAVGLVLMLCILSLELVLEGQKNGRLTWPYGDEMPGSYLSKVGLPVLSIMIALACSAERKLASLCGFLALLTLGISTMTGERVNFLIRACGGMLAAVAWRPKWKRVFALLFIEVSAILFLFFMVPDTANRFTKDLVRSSTQLEESGHLQALNGGWIIARDFSLSGIGTANYRFLSGPLLENIPNTVAHNHPHNFYIQILAETGVVGLALSLLFLGSILGVCAAASLRKGRDVVVATAWIIPFGLLWPFTTTGDFFGQWQNIFMWSAIAIGLCATQHSSDQGTSNTPDARTISR